MINKFYRPPAKSIVFSRFLNCIFCLIKCHSFAYCSNAFVIVEICVSFDFAKHSHVLCNVMRRRPRIILSLSYEICLCIATSRLWFQFWWFSSSFSRLSDQEWRAHSVSFALHWIIVFRSYCPIRRHHRQICIDICRRCPCSNNFWLDNFIVRLIHDKCSMLMRLRCRCMNMLFFYISNNRRPHSITRLIVDMNECMRSVSAKPSIWTRIAQLFGYSRSGQTFREK